jgi:hypothetical protein
MRSLAIVIAVLAAASPATAGVVVESATDASRCTSDERAQNTTTLRRTLDRLSTQLSTTNAGIDATIVSLSVEPAGALVVVSAQVRLAISDENGRLLTVLTGGAKVEMSAREYRARKLPRMRQDAVVGAVEGMFGKVKASLRQLPRS